MRIALSILVCVAAAMFFSLNAHAGYNEELSLYDNCKKQYANGSCDAVPMFSKKSLIEQSSKCQVSPELVASLESSITCSSVNSINKTCFDKFKPQITQLVSNHCASENQKAAQAVAASSRNSASAAGGSQPGKSKDSGGGADLADLAKTVGAPLLEATGLKDKLEGYGKKVLNDGFSNSVKKDDAKVSHESAVPAPQQRGNASVNDTSNLKGDAAKGVITPNFDVKKPSADPLYRKEDQQAASENLSPAPSADVKSATDGPADAAEAQKQLAADAAAAKGKLPAAVNQIADVEKAAQPGVAQKAAEGASTEITQTAEEANASLLNESKAVSSKANKLIENPDLRFEQTKAAVDKAVEKIKKYVETVKKTCTSSSEKAGFLCLEGTSPGIKTAKATMDVAGPALALINSAQKSCSATADVTRLVGTGLTIAKGACVASKLYCDYSCTTAVKAADNIKADNFKTITGAFTQDANIALAKIAETRARPDIMKAKFLDNEFNEKASITREIIDQLNASLEKEKVPTNPGTAQGTVVKCEGHMKDIALLAANIAGTMQAQKGAKACAEKLKTGGEGPTVAEYCAQPANVSSSYCKCQRDNSQVGCSGNIVTGSTFDRPADDKGSVQRGGGGASAFAGPGVNGVNDNIGNVGSPLSSGGTPLNFSDKTNDASASGGARGSGGGAGSAAAGAGGSNPELGTKEEPEKKKWSFGAFTSGFGSFGGGSGSGKGAAGSSKTGQKAMDAERAIASERQWRAEVTGSSGKSNFEKVRESYLKKTTSLIDR